MNFVSKVKWKENCSQNSHKKTSKENLSVLKKKKKKEHQLNRKESIFK